MKLQPRGSYQPMFFMRFSTVSKVEIRQWKFFEQIVMLDCNIDAGGMSKHYRK